MCPDLWDLPEQLDLPVSRVVREPRDCLERQGVQDSPDRPEWLDFLGLRVV